MSIPFGTRILAAGVLASALFCGPTWAEPADASSTDPAPASGPASQPTSTSPDDFLMGSGSMVNEFTGQPSLSLGLGSVTGGNDLAFGANLQFYGGVEEQDRTNVQFYSGSWVGLGFSLKWPQIIADHKGTAAMDDDEYFLSMDGQPVRLVGRAGDANSFYLKNNRSISVTRIPATATSQSITDPYVIIGAENLPPTYPVTFNLTYTASWQVNMPDGQVIRFDFSGNCEDDNGVMCTPVTIDLMGYQPFFNYSSQARIPDQWNVTRIHDRDNKFSLFFEYDKKKETVGGNLGITGTQPAVTADRAVYLKRVYSVNGTTPTSELMGEMTIVRKAKPVTDWFESAWGQPLARFEKECVDYIQLSNLSNVIRKYVFQYGSTARSKLRLERIDEVEPVFSKTRMLHQFTYDPTDAWKLAKVVDQKGVETEFEWTQYSGLRFSNTFDLTSFFNGQAANLAGTRVKTRLEYGNSYYFSVESEATCTDPGDVRRDKLFQFRNNGGYWELAHVFVAPKANCEGEFFLAPDATYLLHVARTNGTNSEITVYDLPPKEDYALYPNGVPQVVNLGTSAQVTKTTFTGLPGAPTEFKKSVFAFKKWFAYAQTSAGKIRFFHKGTSGTWLDGTKNAAGSTIPCIVSQNSYSGVTETRTNCLDFAGNTLDVRAGSDFLAVFNKGNPGPNVLHVYGYNGGIKEYIKGLRKSKEQKFHDGWGGSGIWANSPSGDDYYNVFDFDILDWSVSGNLLLVNASLYGTPNFSNLYAFAWDGNQLRFLHRQPFSDSFGWVHFAGPDYYVTMRPLSGSMEFRWTKFDLKTWWPTTTNQVFATKPNVSGGSWTVKTLPGFIFLERMASAEISKTYEPAIIGPNADYPHKNQNFLYNLHGDNGGSIAEAPTSLPNSFKLGNTDIRQDMILGVAIPSTGTTEGSHYYGRLNPGPAGNPGGQSSPSWTLNPFAEEGAWGMKSASLLSSGAVMFRHAVDGSAQRFDGAVQFLTSQGGVLSRSAAPTHPWVVSKVHVKTRGEMSSEGDGTLKTLAFNYLGTGAAYNALSQAPNFLDVRKTRQVYEADRSTVQTTFRMDRPDNVLLTSQKGLNGSVEVFRFEPAGIVAKPGGWIQLPRMVADRVSTTPNGAYPLKESIFQLRNQGGEHRKYFDLLYTETRQDLARADAYTGLPTVTVSRQGSSYSVSIVRFEHEYTGARPFSLVRQTANFLFTSDPCTFTNGEYCGNITPSWLMTSPQNARAVSSQIFKYSAAGLMTESWQWRPATLGTPLPTLDGNTGVGTWHRASTVLEWQRDNAAARSKHLGPTLVKDNGLNVLAFYGGSEGRLLGTVNNATRNTATLLTGEEASVTAGRFGAFGEWENAGSSLSTTVTHTGKYSLRTTQIYGPTVNIYYWNGGNSFWNKKKGFHVSAWIFVDGTRGSTTTDPYPAFSIQLRNAQHQDLKVFDLVADYPAANLPYNRWVKLERTVTWSELNTWIPNSGSYMRIWAGKASSANTRPVYVDDFRIHPVDASATVQVYNEHGKITASLDGNNDPTYYQYDAWGRPLGAKDARGIGYSATGGKAFSE